MRLPLDWHRVNLDWLFWLRWGAVSGQALTIGVARFGFEIPLPLPWLGAVVAAQVVFNLGVRAWMGRANRVGAGILVGGLAFDIVALTALLLMSGGPHNPFSFLYLVYIALAAVVLAPRWTWSLVGLAALGSALLFVLPSYHLHIHGDQNGLFNLHLQGMWVAFTVAASFIVYFVMRIRSALAAREAELQQVHAFAERQDRLSALGTLAAGAAHELATPLATIATIAKELEHALTFSHVHNDLIEDARLMRSQVQRCSRVLQQMSADTGAAMSDKSELFSLGSVLDDVQAQLAGEYGMLIRQLGDADTTAWIRSPRAPLRQALTNLIKNGWDACVAAGIAPEVRVEAQMETGVVHLLVSDAGVGMEAAVAKRAGEPFFTTKGTGKGMGLGVFVARSVTERLGGHFELVTTPHKGTTAHVRLPVLARPTTIQ